MPAKNWKETVSELRNNDKYASLFGNIKRVLSSIMNSSPAGVGDIVGLDIGPERIKLLIIHSNSLPYQVVEYDAAPLPSGSIVKDEIKNPAAIGVVLRDMMRKSGITAKYAAVAIPRTLAMIKNITVDKRLSADDIESRAWIEANRLFPDLVGNIYLDFTVTGPSIQVPDQMELLLVACRKEHIKPYLEIMQIAGLIPKIVDVNCYALERALQLAINKEQELKTVALLNVNVSQSSLVVLHNKQLVHAHDQTYDGSRLIKQVNEFTKNKHAQPGMEDAIITVADAAYLALLQENFLSHLRHTIHFFYSSRSNITIDKIILAGDCTIIPDFAAFIEKEIGVKTELADPFAQMKVNARLNTEEISQTASTLMLCSGLALSSMGG